MSTAKRVLIVEDDAHIAELLRLHLHDEGFEVVHATDGNEGLRLLEGGGWDALVLDLMLPGVDGLEICRRARTMARYTPIIITSARSSVGLRASGVAATQRLPVTKHTSAPTLAPSCRAVASSSGNPMVRVPTGASNRIRLKV